MMKLAGFALLAVAVVLLVWGWDASASLPSDLSRIFRGGPSDRTLWFIVGGAAAGVLGLGLLYSSRHRKA